MEGCANARHFLIVDLWHDSAFIGPFNYETADFCDAVILEYGYLGITEGGTQFKKIACLSRMFHLSVMNVIDR